MNINYDYITISLATAIRTYFDRPISDYTLSPDDIKTIFDIIVANDDRIVKENRRINTVTELAHE